MARRCSIRRRARRDLRNNQMSTTKKLTAGARTQTTLHHYSFDTSTPEGKAGYAEMCERIKANSTGRGRKMHCISDRFDSSLAGSSERVILELGCLFENQWNETTRRLFDWFEEAIFRNGRENKTIKRGHWLEITPRMASVRRDTLTCGYCGKHYGPLHDEAPANGFCCRIVWCSS